MNTWLLLIDLISATTTAIQKAETEWPNATPQQKKQIVLKDTTLAIIKLAPQLITQNDNQAITTALAPLIDGIVAAANLTHHFLHKTKPNTTT